MTCCSENYLNSFQYKMENQLTDKTILTKLWLLREIGNNIILIFLIIQIYLIYESKIKSYSIMNKF